MKKTVKNSPKNAEMSSMIAHELRSPIGAIRAAASLLADGSYGKLPRKAKETAMLIQNAADRLLSQTEGYLRLMQLSSGFYEAQNEPYAVEDLIKKLIAEWKPQAKLKKLKLKSAFRNIPDTLFIDQALLTHVIYNLLDNAIRYTDSGFIEVNVTWRAGILTILIKDTGRGITTEIKKELFKHPKYCMKKNRSKGCGMGLGLYIVAEFIKSANGTIDIQSKGKNKGSTFIVHLPAVKVDGGNTNR
ncbi:MAG: HAMP domain-containing sensor histidine kinase [Patescibacteria group bacterium]|nr:HAMP domain-containing sensor histidine kinase [Patescibacteria group bacterium]